MAIAFVQQKSGAVYTGSANTTLAKTLTMPGSTTGGNAIVVMVAHPATNLNADSATVTVTDSAGNTYTQIASISTADGAPSVNAYTSMYVTFNAAAATTVTATMTWATSANRQLFMMVAEFSGIGSTRAVTETFSGASSVAADNEIGDLVVCMMGASSGTTADQYDSVTAGYTWLDGWDGSTPGAVQGGSSVGTGVNFIRGGYQVADGVDEAGASWTVLTGGHGHITAAFALTSTPLTITAVTNLIG